MADDEKAEEPTPEEPTPSAPPVSGSMVAAPRVIQDDIAVPKAGSGTVVAQPQQFGVAHQLALGVTMGSAESEAIKRLTPEHISSAIDNRHKHSMRGLDLQEKTIDLEERERVRSHERDQRDRSEFQRSDGRLERIFYCVFGSVVLLIAVLLVKDKDELALKVLGLVGAGMGALLGGMGIESWRRSRRSRTKRPGSDQGSED